MLGFTEMLACCWFNRRAEWPRSSYPRKSVEIKRERIRRDGEVSAHEDESGFQRWKESLAGHRPPDTEDDEAIRVEKRGGESREGSDRKSVCVGVKRGNITGLVVIPKFQTQGKKENETLIRVKC